MTTREYNIYGSENIAFSISIYVQFSRAKHNNKRVQVLKGYFSQLTAERDVVCLKHHFAENERLEMERMLELWVSTQLVILFL